MSLILSYGLAMSNPSATTASLVSLIQRLAPDEGFTRTGLPNVQLMRASRPLARGPVLYEPCLCVVVQGRKRGFLDAHSFAFDADHYLVAAVPMLFVTETEATVSEPMLGITLRIDVLEVAELALTIDEQHTRPPTAPTGLVSTPLDDRLRDALLRLLQALQSPLEARLLTPGILREIYFHVLGGAQGAGLRAALTQGGPFGKIAKALRRIHAEYAGALDVGTLASDAGMSVAVFHAHFKAITATSPIQYLKSTRLHQARLLMVREGVTAASAANSVGYESASQFSREFKRFFGRSPTEEAQEMQEMLALRAAA